LKIEEKTRKEFEEEIRRLKKKGIRRRIWNMEEEIRRVRKRYGERFEDWKRRNLKKKLEDLKKGI
jgi:hypothetical protein